MVDRFIDNKAQHNYREWLQNIRNVNLPQDGAHPETLAQQDEPVVKQNYQQHSSREGTQAGPHAEHQP